MNLLLKATHVQFLICICSLRFIIITQDSSNYFNSTEILVCGEFFKYKTVFNASIQTVQIFGISLTVLCHLTSSCAQEVTFLF